jgi:outer membrane immunogenic protein
MKKLLLGTVALAALGAGVTANAAELAVRRPAVRVAAPVAYTNWTGCHLGGSVGNEWGRDRGYTTTGASTTISTVIVPDVPGGPTGTFLRAIPAEQEVAPGFDMNGFTGGFYGGCDYQFGAWVVGIEGDWSNVNKSGQTFDNFTFRTNAAGAQVEVSNPLNVTEAQERWYATLRGRLGYAVDKWLLYVTGGAAWARIDSSEWNILNPIPTALLQTDTRTGWTVGAGIEYAVGWGWSVRSEYLYIDIPSYTTFTGAGTLNGPFVINPVTHNFAGPPTNLSTRLNNNVWRFGLTYKFGNYAAAAAVTK